MIWHAIREWWSAVAWITAPLIVALEVVLLTAFGTEIE